MRISDWSSDVCSSDLRTDFREGYAIDGIAACDAARGTDPGGGGMFRNLRDTGQRVAQHVHDMGLWPRQQRVDPQFDQLIPESRLARFLDEAIEVRRVSLKVNDGVRGIFQTARSEEHTSEIQSLMRISYAVFCLKKKT